MNPWQQRLNWYKLMAWSMLDCQPPVEMMKRWHNSAGIRKIVEFPPTALIADTERLVFHPVGRAKPNDQMSTPNQNTGK